MSAVKVVMIDNYDSFTYNLVQYFGELGAEVSLAVPADGRANNDAQLTLAVEAQIAKRATVGSTRHRLQLINNLHRPKLRCPGDAPARKTRRQRRKMRHLAPQPAFHGGNQMLHLRKFFQFGEFRHLH